MNQVERREHNRDPKDELLPEVLALLKSCGAEIPIPLCPCRDPVLAARSD